MSKDTWRPTKTTFYQVSCQILQARAQLVAGSVTHVLSPFVLTAILRQVPPPWEGEIAQGEKDPQQQRSGAVELSAQVPSCSGPDPTQVISFQPPLLPKATVLRLVCSPQSEMHLDSPDPLALSFSTCKVGLRSGHCQTPPGFHLWDSSTTHSGLRWFGLV